VALAVPADWSAEALAPTRFRQVTNGRPVTTRWRVTPPPGARWEPRPVSVVASYHGGRTAYQARDTASVTVEPVANGVGAPYRTASTVEATRYGSTGDQLAVWAGGRDLSGWVDEKAAIYRRQVAGPTSTVLTRVVDQKGGGPIAKAGLAIANDLTAPGNGGYAVLLMTATGGVEFMWDGNGDGRLDGWAGGGASFHPAWLKLVRDATRYTAYASSDGTDWRQVGSATVASAAGDADAGVVASAVNLDYPGRVTRAVFDTFTITGGN
jgi:NPCBM-associated, NEW3 domain of alpha-galactosidase